MSRFRAREWGQGFAAPLEALQGELNRLFEEYWNPERATAPSASPTDLEPAEWAPPIDLLETANELIVRVDLPGIDPAKVDLSLTGEVLTIRGERPAEAPADAHLRIQQRPVGGFVRHVTLPGAVALEGIDAQFKQGVLTIRLPKHAQDRPRTITIQPN